MAEKRDWAAIKNEYVTGRESLQKLAERREIPLRTIKDRSSKERWAEERKNFRTGVAQKASQKTAKKEAARLVKLREVAETVADLIKEDVEQLMVIHRERKTLTESDVKMIKDLTVALKNIADVMRDVYQIPNIREKLQLDKYKDYKKTIAAMETEEGGVIILADVLEESEINGETKEEESDLATAAETD